MTSTPVGFFGSPASEAPSNLAKGEDGMSAAGVDSIPAVTSDGITAAGAAIIPAIERSSVWLAPLGAPLGQVVVNIDSRCPSQSGSPTSNPRRAASVLVSPSHRNPQLEIAVGSTNV